MGQEEECNFWTTVGLRFAWDINLYMLCTGINPLSVSWKQGKASKGSLKSRNCFLFLYKTTEENYLNNIELWKALPAEVNLAAE